MVDDTQMDSAPAVEGFRASVQQLRRTQRQAAPAVMHVELPAGIEARALRQALHAAVQRHEILRTRLRMLPGMQRPLQVIGEGAEFAGWDIDAHGDAPDMVAGREAALVEQIVHRLSDPSQPALASGLIRRTRAPSRWLLVLPAACADRATLLRLASEVAHSLQGAAPLTEPLQYADFAEWQHELQQGAAGDAGRAFWQRQVDRAALQARHPFERGRAAGGRLLCHRELDRVQTDRLLTAAGGMRSSISNLVFVCWAALLQRQLGTPGVVVAWQHEGRNELTRDALGPYAKRLPLRMDQASERSLDESVRALEARLAEADAMQDSFDGAGLDAEASPWPFGFRFDDSPALPEGWRLLDLQAPDESAALDLRVTRDRDACVLALEADAGRFTTQALDGVLDQLSVLLGGACEQPQQPLRSIACSSVAQTERLRAVQRPTTDIDAPPLLHQLFEQQVLQRPHAIALEFGAQRLSYRELDQRANRVAHRLRRAGLRPEQAVGLFLGRSIEAIVGLLGILKAGGAYLPLDPAYPQERLAYMLQDSAAPFVLTVGALRDALPPSPARTLMLEDADSERADDPLAVNHPDQLAYLIYTSGSTGQPKGVMVSHRNAVHSTRVRAPAYGRPCEAFLLLSSISFDSSVAGLFWALSQGGRLCLPADAQVLDLQALAELIATHGISHTLMLPSLYAQLLANEAPADRPAARLQSLRCVIVAGEAAASALARRHHAACPQASLYNEYGPTEGSVWCTLYRSEADEPGAVMPIGFAVPNMQVHVLDDRQQPQPFGIAGEIAIGGAGIVRGYLRRAALTAERFVPDPFGAPGARLYRTGDVGRFGADACLEFLGRADHQVKIRGFRIELGEIEAALVDHPQLREAAVVARRPAGDDEATAELRLVAYIVPRGAEPEIESLRAHLLRRLPEHMLPSSFVMLDALPLTPNGKLDRAALPEPQAERRPYAAPRNETEALLAQIWGEVLNVERVGLNDDFFELGGHSLLATRLVSRVRAALRREVPVRAVFQHPRLIDFAAQVALSSGGRDLPAIVPAPRDRPLPLSFAQQRLWFFDRLHPRSTVYNVADRVRLRGPLDLGALQRSVGALVARHESLRTRFDSADGKPVQRIDAPQPVPLPVIDLTALPADERETALLRWLDAEAAAPFDLSQGPLLRVGVVRLEAQHHVLWLTMHHIVSDGWSMRVLVRELTACYEAFCAGRDPAWAALPVQVADHAHWQRSAALGTALQEQLAFWRQHAQGPGVPLRLPGMRPRPAVQSHRGDQIAVPIDAPLVPCIDELGKVHGATRFMVLLSVFKALLAAASGQREIRVGVPIANRHRLELEGLIGFFVNPLALRTAVEPQAPFSALLAQVRDTLLAAQSHQDLPFEQLVDALQPPRDPGCSPLFQVMFDLHRGRVLSQERIGDLAIERLPGAPARTTMFDLMLDITETDEGLSAIFTYGTDLFERGAVRGLAQAYVGLLQAVLEQPEAPLQRLTPSFALLEEGKGLPGEDAAEQVLDAACAVLGLAHIDTEASFFDQGGSSLRALAWIERLNRRWCVDIPVQLVFLHPTIADFIAAVRPYAGGGRRMVQEEMVPA